jgi:hypothetical protein
MPKKWTVMHSCVSALRGLTLVRFSAQPVPSFTHYTRRMPQKVLTLSREVDECKPLPSARRSTCAGSCPAAPRDRLAEPYHHSLCLFSSTASCSVLVHRRLSLKGAQVKLKAQLPAIFSSTASWLVPVQFNCQLFGSLFSSSASCLVPFHWQ